MGSSSFVPFSFFGRMYALSLYHHALMTITNTTLGWELEAVLAPFFFGDLIN
jgi:hypothetical protein